MQEEAIELIENLVHSLKSRGIKKTTALLKVVKENSLYNTDEFSAFVIDNICRLTNTNSKDLINGRYIRGEIKFAVGLCVFYLYQRHSIGAIHRHLFSTKGRSLLSKYKQFVFSLNPKFKGDQKYLAIKKEMDELINTYNKNK